MIPEAQGSSARGADGGYQNKEKKLNERELYVSRPWRLLARVILTLPKKEGYVKKKSYHGPKYLELGEARATSAFSSGGPAAKTPEEIKFPGEARENEQAWEDFGNNPRIHSCKLGRF